MFFIVVVQHQLLLLVHALGGDLVEAALRRGVLVRRRRRLAVDHLDVLGDAVAVFRVDVRLDAVGHVLGGRPGQVVPAHLDVVVGELAELVVVHAEELGLLGRAELEAGDLVDDEGDERRHDEGVRAACEGVGHLDVELLVVVVEPAACDEAGVDAVEADDVVGGEEGVEQEADDAGDGVLCQHVHAVVDLDPELDCGRVSTHPFVRSQGRGFLLFVEKLETMPVTTPRMTDAQSGMKPEVGVAATRPEMQPEHQPTMDHFLARRKSRRTQVAAATMLVKHELKQAYTARRLAPNDDPPLNPNHPNHSRIVPRVMRETL